ncbi:peptide ABC transporter substrate-binding protein [Pigmentibacter ruber]|nr:ABC transporter substrate-binding protein [Pigmentibacter ruber]
MGLKFKVILKYFLLFYTFLFSSQLIAADLENNQKAAKVQKLNISNGTEIATLDPQKSEDAPTTNVVQDLFEGLIRNDINGVLQPAGATSWKISKDGLTYVFHLRKNAKWSNGDIITADDYVYGFQRLVDPKVASSYSFLIFPIKNSEAITQNKLSVDHLGVRAIDKETLEITLTSPVPYFLEILAMVNCSPAKKDVLNKQKDDFFQVGKIINNGPFLIKYWKVGDKITLVKNPNYWNAKKTILEEVNYFPTQSLNTVIQMYETGQIDFTNEIPTDLFEHLKKKLPQEVKINPYLAAYWLSFNLKKKPFKDNLKLRQALSMVVDRDVLTKQVTRRGEIPTYDIVALGTKNYSQQKYEWTNLSFKDRVTKAKKLYEEAGYGDKNPLKIKITYSTNENNKKLVLAVASMWKQHLNIDVTLENQEWKVFLDTRHKGEYEVAWDRWIADYNDANTFLDIVRSDSEMNSPKYSNKKFDQLLKLSAFETDLKKRRKLLEDASTIFMQDYAIVPLYSAVTTHLVKSYVGGYSGKNPQDFNPSFDLYIKEH